MNLLHDPWIPIRRRDGGDQRISFLQVVDQTIAPVEIAAPRPDFTSALYQLAIGLLQTAFAANNLSEWSRRYVSPPSFAELETAFSQWQHAFVVDSVSGPAFFQDFDDLATAEFAGIAQLLIEAPGEETEKKNTDLFIHAGTVQALCPGCAAAALLTLQINAPTGGRGNRVSLRGGGPLTTLRLPRDPEATLFQRLWSNVVPVQIISPDEPGNRADVMPWLAATRTSEKGQITTPEDVHPLQSFFSMPRRIRLDWKTAERATCDLCGEQSDRCLRQYRTRPYGVNYGGAWLHPLTPYNLDPKQADLPISIKGQRGGIGYRQWLGLAVGDDEGRTRAARVVNFFNRQGALPSDAGKARLWCCGYDMDNMKARCWYDATVPLPEVSEGDLSYLTQAVREVLDCAGETAALAKKQVGVATHPDGTGDPAVSQSFWHATESSFYRFLRETMRDISIPTKVGAAAKRWALDAREQARQIFDAYVLAVPIHDGDMKQVVKARAGLERSFFGGKSKGLWNWATRQEEAAE